MTHRYLTVLLLWSIFGAFICQYENEGSEASGELPDSASDDRLSRRELAMSLRETKAVRLIYPDRSANEAPGYTGLIQALAKAFPDDWDVQAKKESELTDTDLRDVPLIIIGREFQQAGLQQLLDSLPFIEKIDHFQFHHETYDQKDQSYRLSLYPNPSSRTPVFVVGGNSDEAIFQQLTLEEGQQWNNIFWRNWGYEIYQGREVIVRGNLKDRDWTFEPDQHFDFSRRQVVDVHSEHFRFHDLSHLGTDYVEKLADACETQLQNLRNFTGSDRPIPTIDYYIYPTIEEKGLRLMNTDEGHLVQEHREVHVVINKTFLGQHTHQDLQLILQDLLGPADKVFLREGLPTQFNEHWQERGALYWATRLYRSDNLPPLRELLDDEGFVRESPLVMTAAAGSLVHFLIDHWGKDAFLQRYRKWESLNPTEEQAIEKGWHQFLADHTLPPTTEHTAPLPYYQGFNFAHEGYQIYNGYGSDLARKSLEKLSDLGTNAVAIVPYGFMRNANQPSFPGVHHGAGGENDESVIYAHAEAQSLGMSTLLKPQIWISGSWPGDVAMTSEADWDQFFDYYYRWIRHYALMAEIRKFDAFCLGVEFTQATLSHPDAWREIIHKIRGIYSGPITYAANWGEEFEQISFWDEFDFIGLDCYYPLSKAEQPSKRELQRNFAEVLEKAEKVAKKFNKPLVFTEIGFRSVKSAWINPHAEPDGRPYSAECQELCYEVIFEGIQDEDWINGLFIWKWPSYLEYQKHNPLGFTPNDKPAEAVVRRWFGNGKATR